MYRTFIYIGSVILLLTACATTNTMKTLRRYEYLYQQGDTGQFDNIVDVLLENTEASRDAALTLGRLGDTRATPYLANTIRNEELAAPEALIAIEMLNDARAITDLIQIVKLDRPLAREAIRILGRMRDERALPILMRVIEENRPYSLLATEALGEIGDNKAKDLLLSRLKQTPVRGQETIRFRILQQEGQKSHNLTFELPRNLPPKIEITDRMIEPEGYAIFRYLLKDAEYDSLDILAEFSLNNGRNWHPSSTEGNINAIVETRYQGSVVWRMDRDIDLNVLQLDPSVGLLFKLTPVDKYSRTRRGVPAVWNMSVDSTTIDLVDIDAEESGDVLMQVYYPNPARASQDSFAYHYTFDNGVNWYPAEVRLGRAGEVVSPDSMYIIWSSETNLPNLDLDAVQFRISESINNTYGRFDITQPFHLDNNEVPQVQFSNFKEDIDGLFYIGYQIEDAENDTVSLEIQYSNDEGMSWRKATVSGDLSTLTPDQYIDNIRWYADFDITDFTENALRLRLRPADRDPGLFTDSRSFFLKNADFSKLTQGNGTGLVELSYSLAPSDSVTTVAQYSLDRGRTWHNATLRDIQTRDLQDRRNVSVNWDIGRDIASYFERIGTIGSALERIQDPSIVPDLLYLARQRNSRTREMRHQAVEASRILDKKPPWIVTGLMNSLIYPDETIQTQSLAILRTLDSPEITTAINDYQKYLDDITLLDRENLSLLNEIDEQLYQDNLRKPRTVTQEESIENMRRWWGFPRARAENFIKDIDVLKQQTILRENYRAGRISEKDYRTRLEQLLLDARERRSREREQRNGEKKNGGKKIE